ncbi:MAG: CYTH domain-containing protein [Gammaproteobacteria bacterium]|nr:CYTH domain-containing protein [Gammaproteobacteria bacterium]
MAQEIERKFLVTSDDWRDQVRSSAHYRQGYLANEGRCSVRVRVSGANAHLNIKSATLDIVRTEYEYPVPLADGEEMLDRLCSGLLVEKTRHFVDYGGFVWEIDVFEGVNRGLVIAEIELDHENTVFPRPSWVGAEVSADPRYYNVYLAQTPYTRW